MALRTPVCELLGIEHPVFLAGMGEVAYADACKAAIEQGVIVNTIFCGDEAAGVNTKWKDGATLADGSYTSINQDTVTVAIEAPQDKELAELNSRLNSTYYAYSRAGDDAKKRQLEADAEQTRLGGTAQLAQRANAKAQAYYDNAAWDLIEGVEEKQVKLEKLKDEQLPEAIRGKTLEEKRKWVDQKLAERKALQAKINDLYQAREDYVAAERRKLAENAEQTLDQAMRKMIRGQLTKKGFKFESEAERDEAANSRAENDAK